MKNEYHQYALSSKKRIFDISLGIFLLLILFPLYTVVAILIFITNGLPIIYVQRRIGKDKKVFKVYKFRTMILEAEKWQYILGKWNESISPMFKMRNDPRFFPIGRILSLSGIDEIPQIINILFNDMSFVGPRPLPVNEAKLLDGSWDYRYKVKPGIFSLWALSNEKHRSKKKWQELEKRTIQEIDSPRKDFLLILQYVIHLFKRILTLNRL